MKKNERMYQLFGRHPGWKCKDCCHLHGEVNEYRKCEVYGITRSEATDWRLSYDACGLFNKPYEGDVPVIRFWDKKRADEQVEGQMRFVDV